MNFQMTKKQVSLIIGSIILLGALAYGAYYLLLKPINDKLEWKKTELEMANQESVIIENSLKQSNEKTFLSSMELQKQVPVKRLLDQLMLDIEKAEIMSDTNIIELKLNGTQKDEEIDFKQNENNTATLDETDSANTNDKEDEVLPNGIKQVSITLSGEAATYFDLEKFINTLQNLKRIVKVEALKFTGLTEIYSVEQPNEVVKFELTLVSYYFPTLEDLRDELPPLDIPAAANKKNPLSSFPVTESEEQKENQP